MQQGDKANVHESVRFFEPWQINNRSSTVNKSQMADFTFHL